MQERRRGYEARDLFRLKTVSDPQISPDGSRVAFVVGEIDEAADGYRSAIWLTATDSGEIKQLTSGVKRDSQPRWSPDGRTLAFLSDRDGERPQLYLLPMEGGEPRRLTSLERGVSVHVWSPDGAQIAVLSRTGGTEKPKPGTTLPPLVITAMKRKANGQGFFDGSHAHVFLVSAATGETRQVTDGDWDDGQIAWSADSAEIAFVSARHPERDSDMMQDIWAVPAAGGEARNLTEGFGFAAAPSYAPDGRTLAFIGHTAPTRIGVRPASIWLLSRDETPSEPRSLTASLDRSVATGLDLPVPVLTWTADSSAIVARIEDRAALHCYRIAAADGTLTRLIGGPPEAGSVESVSMAGDGRLACVISDVQRPGEVYAANADGSNLRRLTQINDAWLAEVRLPEVEMLRVATADGGEIEGWVYKPLDQEPGRRYPLVLNVHGGPHGAFMRSFRGGYPLVLASQGCAVLQMNPRGSTGWGEAFADYLTGGWGGDRDFAELLASVDQVIAQGWVDPDRLGITGYSYGGIMTNWAIGHSDRFKAAVAGAGAANAFSHFGYSDITFPRYTVMGGPPWELQSLYLRLSAISYVQRIQTPILLLHGDDDLRVNIAQAEEFFTALKYYGKEAVLVRYPGENHMMLGSGKPSHRLDYDQRLLAWFAERLAFGIEQREAAVAGR